MARAGIACVLLAAAALMGAAPAPLPVVAAESVYGDVAQQIGGPRVAVTSILTNPDQDPHLFEASPSVARNLSDARIVITNGIGYDPWVTALLAATRNPGRTAIAVADLAGRKPGDNPHIWYDPGAVLSLAEALAATFGQSDPAHAADFAANLARFRQSLEPVTGQIASLRSRYPGTPVTATEPVFGVMFAKLGFVDRNAAFQLSVMNNTEPSASDVAAFETDLRTRQVRLLVFNSQASDPVALRMQRLAVAAHVPVVAVTETEPAGMTYQAWLTRELDAVDRALRP